jgi:hypothetical protein
MSLHAPQPGMNECSDECCAMSLHALQPGTNECSDECCAMSLHERTFILIQATRGRDPYIVIGEFGLHAP